MAIIKITGNSKRKFAADTIEFFITFVKEDIDSSKALAIVQEQLGVFLADINELGIAPELIHLDENKLSRNEYDKHYGYTVKRTITFRIPFNAALIQKIVNIIREKHLNTEINTKYYLAENAELRRGLLREAFMDSRKNAEAIASAHGQTLKGIELVQDSKYRDYYEDDYKTLSGSIWDINLFEKQTLADKLAGKEIELSETVHVNWIVE